MLIFFESSRFLRIIFNDVFQRNRKRCIWMDFAVTNCDRKNASLSRRTSRLPLGGRSLRRDDCGKSCCIYVPRHTSSVSPSRLDE